MVADGLSAREDLNCAETMLYAADRAYNLGLPKEALKLAAGFGGGMGVEGVCGVLTGGSMVFSAMFVEERGHESDRVSRLNQEFVSKMKCVLGDVRCSHIKPGWRTPEAGCKSVTVEAAKLIEEIIDRELQS